MHLQAVPERPAPARARGRLTLWRTRSVLAALVAVLATTTSAAAESVHASLDAATAEPPGHLLRLSGGSLHLHCTGAPAAPAAPTVLLEAGLGEPALSWAQIQHDLEEEVRVCSYDRAGYGWSGADEGTWSAASAAQELTELLRAAAVDEPVVVVAHSLGALVARQLRQQHPQRVAALVLIDPTDDEVLREAGTPTAAVIERRGLQVLARLGMLRWLGRWLLPRMVDAPPPAALLHRVPALYHSDAISASVRELAGAPASARHLAHIEDRTWGDLPVTVVSAASAPARQVRRHQALAARSSRGVHVMAPAGGHYVHYAAPAFTVLLVRQAVAAATGSSQGAQPVLARAAAREPAQQRAGEYVERWR